MAERKTATHGKRNAIIIILIVANVGQFIYFMYFHPVVPYEDFPLQVTDVTGINRTNYLGKTITLDGYFAYLPTGQAFLTQGMEDFRINAILSETSYVKVIGTFPAGTNSSLTGARVLVKGIIQVDTANSGVTDLQFISLKVVGTPVNSHKDYSVPIEYALPPFFRANKYAVLISGGFDADHAYLRYWNDLKFMMAVLEAFYNYSRSNIYVLYKDGIPEDAGMTVNYSCTYTNLQTVFATLQGKMSDVDDLFIYTSNHGTPDGLCLWDKVTMFPSDFAPLLSALLYHQIILVMGQCYSGHFIPTLSAARRVIMTAASADQYSWACDTEGPWDEFLYHFMDAVRKVTLIGNPVYSDYNNDGKVSMAEAFQYAWYADSTAENPQYDDNGDGIPTSQPLPNNGDGAFGAAAFL